MSDNQNLPEQVAGQTPDTTPKSTETKTPATTAAAKPKAPAKPKAAAKPAAAKTSTAGKKPAAKAEDAEKPEAKKTPAAKAPAKKPAAKTATAKKEPAPKKAAPAAKTTKAKESAPKAAETAPQAKAEKPAPKTASAEKTAAPKATAEKAPAPKAAEAAPQEKAEKPATKTAAAEKAAAPKATAEKTPAPKAAEAAPQEKAEKPATKAVAAEKAAAPKATAEKAPAPKAAEAAPQEKAEKPAPKTVAAEKPADPKATAEKAPAPKAAEAAPPEKAEKPAPKAAAAEKAAAPKAVMADKPVAATAAAETDTAPNGAEPPAADAPIGADAPPKAVKASAPAQPSGFSLWLKKIWPTILRPIAALVTITFVTSLLLGLTDHITRPIILANAAAAADKTRQELLPAADGFEQIFFLQETKGITSMFQATNKVGYVIESYASGYNGNVPVMVAFDADHNIAGVRFLSNTETPGLGQNLVTDTSFAAQFKGRSLQRFALSRKELDGGIVKISSATISSGAAVEAVNNAVDFYSAMVLLEQARPSTPEEINPLLIPDAKNFTQIKATAPNLTDAYRADNGQFVIYTTAPGYVYQRTGDENTLIKAAVAVDENGTVLGVWLSTSGETPGKGSPVEEDAAFIALFTGKTAADIVNGPNGNPQVDITAIAGATVTSDAVAEAIASALNAFSAIKEAA